MRTTKVFTSGNSQAIRIPKDFELHCDEVEIIKKGNEIILREIPKNLVDAYNLLRSIKPEGFFENGRIDLPPQDRDF